MAVWQGSLRHFNGIESACLPNPVPYALNEDVGKGRPSVGEAHGTSQELLVNIHKTLERGTVTTLHSATEKAEKGHWKSQALSKWTSALAAIIKHNQLLRLSRPISGADGGCPVSEIYNVNSFKTRLWNRLPAVWKWETSPGQSRVSGKPSIWILLQSNKLIKASSEGMSSQMLRPSRISYSLTWRDERRGNFFLLVQSIINRVDIKWATKHNI